MEGMVQSVRQPRGSTVPIPATREEIAADIRDKVAKRADGYQPGQQLPLQATLAEVYGVDRVTISRAYAILIEEGLLVSRGRRGTWVAERT